MFTGVPVSSFLPTTPAEVDKLLGQAPSKYCELDPLPTWMLKQCSTHTVPILKHIINLSLYEGRVPPEMKFTCAPPTEDNQLGS